MSAETDIALMMELEDKIDQRIRTTLYESALGSKVAHRVDTGMIQYAIAHGVKNQLLNDNYFIMELAKRIGQKMQNLQY